MPPTPFCPHCLSQEIDWPEVSGDGEIYSYTIVSRAIVPGMERHLPYVPAVIALHGAGGVRLISNIADCEIETLAIGRSVTVRWNDVAENRALPYFAPE